MLDQLVIFGGTGDLTARLLLPALVHLCADGELPDSLRILGIGQQSWDRQRFRDHAGKALATHAADLGGAHAWLLERLDYIPRAKEIAEVGAVIGRPGTPGTRTSIGMCVADPYSVRPWDEWKPCSPNSSP